MIVGTAGHIDHGKTSLVRALTGTDTDSLKEEKARGITVDLGFAYMPGDDGSVIGFVDVPGHERLIRNMLAGAAGIDLMLLAVAADDGVMPQTREHLAILDLMGLQRGIVALTKTDLSDADRIAAARNQIANLLLGTGLQEAEIVPVSSTTGEGIETLRMALRMAAHDTPVRQVDAPFRLAVDRSFTIRGAGTVVTGTVLSGRVRPGDELIVSPGGLPVRVRGLHAQNREAAEGRTGDRCALNLSGQNVNRAAVVRGDMVVAPALHAPTARIDARLRVLATEKSSVTQWMPVHLHHGSGEMLARVVLLSDQPIPPGGEGLVQLVLERPIAAISGDRFVIRDTSARRTLGGGLLIDLRAPQRRRRTAERLARIKVQEGRDDAAVLRALLDLSPGYVDPQAFAQDRAIAPDRMAQLLATVDPVSIQADGRTMVMSRQRCADLTARVIEILTEFHTANPHLVGLGLERLRQNADPQFPAMTFRAFLLSDPIDGLVALDGAWVRLASHEVRLDPADEAVWAEIRPMLGNGARFRPPRVRDIADALGWPEAEIRDLFRALSRMGQLHEIGKDHFFLRDVLGEMVGLITDLDAAKPWFSAADFRDQVDNGRKVAIEILEFLDRHGVTIRRGDLRRLNPRRRTLFLRDTSRADSAPSGGESSPVGRPDFKSGRGCETVLGGFDSHSLPPTSRGDTA